MIQENVARAFSNQSSSFDSIEEKNAILKYMRKRIHACADSFVSAGNYMLELNCGTGIDALHFAKRNVKVLATDVADGMIAETKRKVKHENLEDKIEVKQCSFTEISSLPETGFDFVFSDFGGLNCIPDLSPVVKSVSEKLKPGGRVMFVIMPPVCPWEIVRFVKGDFKTAFRRFKRHGAKSHVEGEHFLSWYFTPNDLKKYFGPDFTMIHLEGLGSLVPPPYSEKFPRKFPRLFELLCKWESGMKMITPFNRWCDHFIIVLKKK
ncbi:MAG: methyltransferase domain-containing protein [Bacteroidia bacterium]